MYILQCIIMGLVNCLELINPWLTGYRTASRGDKMKAYIFKPTKTLNTFLEKFVTADEILYACPLARKTDRLQGVDCVLVIC